MTEMKLQDYLAEAQDFLDLDRLFQELDISSSRRRYAYIVIMPRRCFNMEFFWEKSNAINLPESSVVTTPIGFLSYAKELADDYRALGYFPPILYIDDIIVTGNTVNCAVGLLETAVISCFIEDIHPSIRQALYSAIDIRVLVRSNERLSLIPQLQWKVSALRIEEKTVRHKTARRINQFLQNINLSPVTDTLSASIDAGAFCIEMANEALLSGWETSHLEDAHLKLNERTGDAQSIDVFRYKSAVTAGWATIRRYEKNGKNYFIPQFIHGDYDEDTLRSVVDRLCMLMLNHYVELKSSAEVFIVLLQGMVTRPFNNMQSLYVQIVEMIMCQIILSVFLGDCVRSDMIVQGTEFVFDSEKVARSCGKLLQTQDLENLCTIQWKRHDLESIICLFRPNPFCNLMDLETADDSRDDIVLRQVAYGIYESSLQYRLMSKNKIISFRTFVSRCLNDLRVNGRFEAYGLTRSVDRILAGIFLLMDAGYMALRMRDTGKSLRYVFCPTEMTMMLYNKLLTSQKWALLKKMAWMVEGGPMSYDTGFSFLTRDREMSEYKPEVNLIAKGLDMDKRLFSTILDW